MHEETFSSKYALLMGSYRICAGKNDNVCNYINHLCNKIVNLEKLE